MKPKQIISRLLLVALCLVHQLVAEPLQPDVEKKLSAGDPAALSAIANSQSLDELFKVLMLALTHQFGDQSERVKTTAINAIRRIPDHAKSLGDEIDKLSDQHLTGRARENKFYLLQNIGSPEAIAQIGRFLFDDRNPEQGLPLNDGSFEIPNSHWAANAMGAALGNKLGLKRKPGSYGPDEVKAWQTWWQSPDAASYKGASSVPLTAPTVKPLPSRKAESSPITSDPEPASSTPWSIIVVLIVAACGLLWLLLKRRS